MILRNRFPLIALTLALPTPVLAQRAQDFQLPAPTPTTTPQAQGPVDEGAPSPAPNRPPPIRATVPEPRPTLAIPAPSSPSAAAPAPQRRNSPPSPRPAHTTRAEPVAGASTAVLPQTPTPAAPNAAPVTVPTLAPTPAPAATPSAPALVAEGSAMQGWLWLVGLATILLAGSGAWLWLRRRASAPPPIIEPPLARAAATPSSPETTGGQALTLKAEAVKLTRSFAFATLEYRLTLINRTTQAMGNLAISADLVSAHGNAPMEQQIALPTTELPPRQTIARLAPGQSQQVTGQVQLPIGEAQVIRQGSLPLLVPLLRLRVDGVGDEPLARTFVIGQGAPEGGRLQPFRLDEGPRSYSPISQRALDLS